MNYRQSRRGGNAANVGNVGHEGNTGKAGNAGNAGNDQMKHWIVRGKAIGAKAEAFNWLGGSVGSVWRVMLIVLIGAGVGTIAAHMNGYDLLKDQAAVTAYTTQFTLAVLVIVVVPAWLIRFITDLPPCSTSMFTAAYEDTTLPKWVRKHAATANRDDARARGADGWAAIWEERRAKL